MNKVTVNIQGLEFTLKGEESEEHLNQVGKIVDDLLSTMIRSNRKLNISTAAILTSCNLVDDKLKLEEQSAQKSEKEAAFLKHKAELEAEIRELRSRLSDKEREISRRSSEENAAAGKKEDEIRRLQAEMNLMQESVREYRDDNEQLSKTNKELKFELQSYKYKVLDLQNKLFENQMSGSKDKKEGTQKQAK